MIYTVDYESIFFEKYSLSSEEKRNEAFELILRLIDESELSCTVEDDCIIRDDSRFEEDRSFEQFVEILKKEFYIFLIEKKTEPDKVKKGSFEEYILKMYMYEGFSAKDLCEEFNEPRKKVDAYFAEKYNMPFKLYLKRVRVENAIKLIRCGEKMESISYLCGFGSVKTMRRAFKAVLDTTPATFRTT